MRFKVLVEPFGLQFVFLVLKICLFDLPYDVCLLSVELLVSALVHFLGLSIDCNPFPRDLSIFWRHCDASFKSSLLIRDDRVLAQRKPRWLITDQCRALSMGLLRLLHFRYLFSLFYMLSCVQRSDILSFLRLNCSAVKFNELALRQCNDLVTVLRCQLNHWVSQHSQSSQSDQSRQHWSHFFLEISDQVVVQIQSYQVLEKVKWFAMDEVHLGKVQYHQSIWNGSEGVFVKGELAIADLLIAKEKLF